MNFREFYTRRLSEFQTNAKTQGLIVAGNVLKHQERVGNYAFDIAHRLGKPVDFCWKCWLIGNIHDLVEDCNATNTQDALRLCSVLLNEGCNHIDRSFNYYHCLWKLTRKKGEEYSDYMNNILFISQNSVEEDEIAFIVKQADYKDHFAQVETLTPKLMKKYAPFVHYFL